MHFSKSLNFNLNEVIVISNIRRDGFGILYFEEEGSRYEGKFKNDLFEGKGRIYYKNGTIIEGIYKNGKPLNKYMIVKDKKIYFNKKHLIITNYSDLWNKKMEIFNYLYSKCYY